MVAKRLTSISLVLMLFAAMVAVGQQGMVLSNAPFSGGTITSALVVPDGTAAAPGLVIGTTGGFNDGLYLRAAQILGVSVGSAERMSIGTLGPTLRSDGLFGFSTTTDPSAGIDTGLARSAAGVVKVTDGSTGIRGLLGGGTAVASAAALPLPTGNVFHVTGTTNVTSITSTNFQSGVVITLIFDGVLTFTDGSNLKLAGNFVTTADDTITLVFDGTNWYETSRSVN